MECQLCHQQARQIIKQRMSIDAPSYQELIQRGFYGYTSFYLFYSRNDQTMSTTADSKVAMQLAQIDQCRESHTVFIVC